MNFRPALWLCRLLALLLLVNGAVVAAEVSAHGLCDHQHSEASAVHLHSDTADHDHDAADHLCHAHPPLCAAADIPLPLTAAAPTRLFAQFATALHTRTFAPPVPPPNA